MKKKIGELYNKPIVIGNPNEVTKNEIHISNLNASSSSNGSSMKYYDCIQDFLRGESHDVTLVDNVKAILEENGTTIIAPESVMNWGSFSPVVIAVAIDTENRRCYVDGEWITMKEYAQRFDGFNPDTHTEITEEEFYHIPESIIIPYKDRNKLGEIFEDCYSKLLRLGVQPNGDSAFDSTPIRFPIPFLGYKTISIEINPDYFTNTEPNYINFFFTRSDFYRSNDSWYNYDDPNQKEFVDNVEVVCLELCSSGIAMCRIVYPDGTKEYLCPMVVG